MGILVFALALTVELGGIFGSASAVGTEVDEGTIQVDLTVEMSAGGSVVAHLLEPGGEDRTVALDERLPGVYGGIFETRKIDLVVVFEAVGPPSVQSESVQLTELGLDPALLTTDSDDEEGDGLGVVTESWGWLAIAFGAAALAFLAWWALPERRRRQAASTEEAPAEGETDPQTEDTDGGEASSEPAVTDAEPVAEGADQPES
jgi:hypothetical protein